jgi:hypothetical protein
MLECLLLFPLLCAHTFSQSSQTRSSLRLLHSNACHLLIMGFFRGSSEPLPPPRGERVIAPLLLLSPELAGPVVAFFKAGGEFLLSAAPTGGISCGLSSKESSSSTAGKLWTRKVVLLLTPPEWERAEEAVVEPGFGHSVTWRKKRGTRGSSDLIATKKLKRRAAKRNRKSNGSGFQMGISTHYPREDCRIARPRPVPPRPHQHSPHPSKVSPKPRRCNTLRSLAGSAATAAAAGC